MVVLGGDLENAANYTDAKLQFIDKNIPSFMGKNISSKNQHHARLDRKPKTPHGCISLGCALDTISLTNKTKPLVILESALPLIKET